ncbi:unnamed protein product [Owenia fusiformis]|uniref:Uncharacterized protein n=1 Tax=Owenia fusiformis TaxID=6347 RepID=A0A8J1XFK9_OWEFU|nr:unnamed protein product [Owenia fusiformis]
MSHMMDPHLCQTPKFKTIKEESEFSLFSPLNSDNNNKKSKKKKKKKDKNHEKSSKTEDVNGDVQIKQEEDSHMHKVTNESVDVKQEIVESGQREKKHKKKKHKKDKEGKDTKHEKDEDFKPNDIRYESEKGNETINVKEETIEAKKKHKKKKHQHKEEKQERTVQQDIVRHVKKNQTLITDLFNSKVPKIETSSPSIDMDLDPFDTKDMNGNDTMAMETTATVSRKRKLSDRVDEQNHTPNKTRNKFSYTCTGNQGIRFKLDETFASSGVPVGGNTLSHEDIQDKNKQLVLIKMPKDFDIKSLDGEQLDFSRNAQLQHALSERKDGGEFIMETRLSKQPMNWQCSLVVPRKEKPLLNAVKTEFSAYMQIVKTLRKSTLEKSPVEPQPDIFQGICLPPRVPPAATKIPTGLKVRYIPFGADVVSPVPMPPKVHPSGKVNMDSSIASPIPAIDTQRSESKHKSKKKKKHKKHKS